MPENIRILYFTRDRYPTFRVDISTLFGRLLPTRNIQTTIVAAKNVDAPDHPSDIIDTLLHGASHRNRYFRALCILVGDIRVLFSQGKCFHVIQVRNKVVTAFFAYLAARLFGRKFCYWMSYPYPEDDLIRVKEFGHQLGSIRAGATLIRGLMTKFLLYKIILPLSDHLFLQSAQMAHDVKRLARVSVNRISVVPMAVDHESIDNWQPVPVKVPEGPQIVYLGAMDRARRIDFLLLVLNKVHQSIPATKLLLIGDCIEKTDWRWLQSRAQSLGVINSIVKTGWVTRGVAWSYLKNASVGVCALPNKFIFNSMSPTKAVEMIALGLPMVVTEHPDQGKLVRDSGGGIVTGYDIDEFSNAICQLIRDDDLRRRMGQQGQRYVREHRCYRKIAARLSDTYRALPSVNRSRMDMRGKYETG